mmetsp:Transcript_14146/g.30399  ORF Transcript_14146/g.30399 Transcript_14146/m.30399 type:complete len:483 (-) Transcript_14146:225-1673(-)
MCRCCTARSRSRSPCLDGWPSAAAAAAAEQQQQQAAAKAKLVAGIHVEEREWALVAEDADVASFGDGADRRVRDARSGYDREGGWSATAGASGTSFRAQPGSGAVGRPSPLSTAPASLRQSWPLPSSSSGNGTRGSPDAHATASAHGRSSPSLNCAHRAALTAALRATSPKAEKDHANSAEEVDTWRTPPCTPEARRVTATATAAATPTVMAVQRPSPTRSASPLRAPRYPRSLSSSPSSAHASPRPGRSSTRSAALGAQHDLSKEFQQTVANESPLHFSPSSPQTSPHTSPHHSPRHSPHQSPLHSPRSPRRSPRPVRMRTPQHPPVARGAGATNTSQRVSKPQNRFDQRSANHCGVSSSALGFERMDEDDIEGLTSSLAMQMPADLAATRSDHTTTPPGERCTSNATTAATTVTTATVIAAAAPASSSVPRTPAPTALRTPTPQRPRSSLKRPNRADASAHAANAPAHAAGAVAANGAAE